MYVIACDFYYRNGDKGINYVSLHHRRADCGEDLFYASRYETFDEAIDAAKTAMDSFKKSKFYRTRVDNFKVVNVSLAVERFVEDFEVENRS